MKSLESHNENLKERSELILEIGRISDIAIEAAHDFLVVDAAARVIA